MILLAVKCFGFATDFPDPAVGRAPMRGGLLELGLDDGPDLFGHLFARTGVVVDGVEQRAPHVVLLLVVGAIADADRSGAVEIR